MEKSDRLRRARINAGFSSASEAARALGVAVPTYTHHENGTREFNLRAADQYARRFGVSVLWLIKGVEPEKAGSAAPVKPDAEISTPPNASFPPVYQTFPTRSVPLLGRAAAGANGRFVLNGQKVMDVFCPPVLTGVEGAYAVYVHGDSMVPRFEAGEIVWLHPYQPVRKGDYVVAQIAGDFEGDDMDGYVKQFISMNDTTLTLHQFNPGPGETAEIKFPAAKVFSVHKIVFHQLA